ncbi:MAG TPA: hypothetical protein VFZ70_15445 [Euzebyales bacterium]
MLVFVHINKTAGSTVRYMLRSSYGPRHCDVEPWHAAWRDPPFSAEDLRRVRTIYPRLRSIAGHRIFGHVDLGVADTELAYLTFVRDPLKTAASRYQYHIDHRGKDVAFDEWIERDWFRDAQTRRIAGIADAQEAIRVIERRQMFVGLAERFDESMILLQALRARDLDISYRRVNVAKRTTIATDLLANERTRQMLTEANQQDLVLYRHVTEELYPRLQRAYGSRLDAAVADYRRADQRFNRRNIALSRMRQHGVYRPLLSLYRRPGTRPAVETLLT